MIILNILKQAFTISIFVLVMMTVLEYLAVSTRGKMMQRFQDKPFWQIILATLLGIVPGCMGTFAVVSMYIHGSVRFGALIAALIATSGDEAFVMFSMIPQQAVIITIALFVIAVVSGILVNILVKKPMIPQKMKEHIVIHESEAGYYLHKKISLKDITWQRLVILSVLLLFIAGLILGQANTHEHVQAHAQKAHQGMPAWQLWTFVAISGIGFLISLISPNHFLNEHIWGHVIKKHFLRIFLWTFGAFVVLHFLNNYLNVRQLIEENNYVMYIVLLIAVLVGLIPESGPHIIFVSLFAAGMVPFSILLASSIVQDGHGAIPLLAETRKGFIKAKIINALVGIIVGYAILFAGF